MSAGHSRRGFLLVAGAGAAASALIYSTHHAVAELTRARTPAGAGFVRYIDRDGWMLAPSDSLRTTPGESLAGASR